MKGACDHVQHPHCLCPRHDEKKREATLAPVPPPPLPVDGLNEATGDGICEPYPTSRSLSFEYESVIKGMQPLPAPAPSPDVVKAINAALAQLYVYDAT